MDGRSGDGNADANERRPAAGSEDGPSDAADGTGSSQGEKTGWPYEPDVSVGDAAGPKGRAEASLEGSSDPEVASVFWRVLLLVDVALLCLTIGPLLIVVRDSPGRGFGLLALGVVALGYAYFLYRDFRDGDGDDGDGDDGDGGDHTEDDDGSGGDDATDDDPAAPERNR